MEIDFSVMAVSQSNGIRQVVGFAHHFLALLGIFLQLRICFLVRALMASVFIVPSVRIPLPSSMVLTSILCGVMLLTCGLLEYCLCEAMML
ncbi:hypothetical protein F2Q69_00062054 [Brassica cretica]|uniref:Uncharacterized protein n=1 Tax=Brassica cretica TaxID=69181 RepID=A0A8S9REF4_BRACR|nr:hypothetical protein F2Q69_00062054 [Brassica cretica]